MYRLNIRREKIQLRFISHNLQVFFVSTNHCIIYIQRKKNMVDLFCYNHLHLNITNVTFIITHFIVVFTHQFSLGGKQIFVDMWYTIVTKKLQLFINIVKNLMNTTSFSVFVTTLKNSYKKETFLFLNL